MRSRCSRCGREKTSRETNAGWWELKPRGIDKGTTHWFCPDCAPRLLVAVDVALEGAAVAPLPAEPQRVVSVSFLRRLAWFLIRWERERPRAPVSAELAYDGRRLLTRLEVLLPPVPRLP